MDLGGGEGLRAKGSFERFMVRYSSSTLLYPFFHIHCFCQWAGCQMSALQERASDSSAQLSANVLVDTDL